MTTKTRNAMREIGGVLRIAVLAAVFSTRGGYATPTAFVDGLVPALTIGAITVAIGTGGRLMTGPRKSSTGGPAVGKVLLRRRRGGHGGPPNGVNGRTGSGERDPGLVQGSSSAVALTGSVRATRAPAATDTAKTPLPLEPWALTIRTSHLHASGGTHRFLVQEANNVRVA